MMHMHGAAAHAWCCCHRSGVDKHINNDSLTYENLTAFRRLGTIEAAKSSKSVASSLSSEEGLDAEEASALAAGFSVEDIQKVG